MVRLNCDGMTLEETREFFECPDDSSCFLLKGAVVSLRERVFTACVRNGLFKPFVVDLEQDCARSELARVTSDEYLTIEVDVCQQFRVQRCLLEVIERFLTLVCPQEGLWLLLPARGFYASHKLCEW